MNWNETLSRRLAAIILAALAAITVAVGAGACVGEQGCCCDYDIRASPDALGNCPDGYSWYPDEVCEDRYGPCQGQTGCSTNDDCDADEHCGTDGVCAAGAPDGMSLEDGGLADGGLGDGGTAPADGG